MANVYAVKNGNWSDVTVWNTGALPTTADDVYADGRLIYIDINTRVLSISNGTRPGGTVNGYFIGNNNISLSADVICRDGSGGTVFACLELLSAAPSVFTMYGNVLGSDLASNGRAIRNTASGTLTIFGNVSGGAASGSTFGVDNQSTGTINVIGNVVANNLLNAGAINNNSTGTINVTGNVFGSNRGANSRGITNAGAGTVNVIGNVAGGSGSGNFGIVSSVAQSRVTIVGNVSGFSVGGVSMGAGTYNQIGSVHSAGLGFTSTSATIVGNVFAGAGAAIAVGGANAVLNVTGIVRGGTASAAVGIGNTSSGTVTVVGSAIGGFTTNCHGIGSSSNTITNLIGVCIGGFGGDCGGVNHSSTSGTFNIIGDVYGGTGGAGAFNTGTGTLNVYGNVYSTTIRGIQNGNAAASGPVNIFGSVFARDTQGVFNQSTTGTITITGDVFGGRATNAYGVHNAMGTGIVVVSGRAVGGTGSAAYGAYNASTGTLRVKRAVGNDWGLGYTTALASVPGVFSNAQGSQTFVEELECGPMGQWPTGGVIFFTPNPKATFQFKTDTFQNYSLIQSISADNLLPPVSSVRQGTIYDLGMDTGTCIIPPASSVGFGVSVDNITGTATLVSTNVWNISSQEITDNQSIGGRLKNALTANAAERLVNSFNLN
jgi:hypothetical protein